ncbi:FUSC family protein [Streptomyces sp. NPDC048514]|uniref:FUSC family protein n=1 Tax=Streptomyces sp. NPDC048514 TaxID=3365564 RepID=UPI003723AB33
MGDSVGVWGAPARRIPAAYAAAGRRAVRVTLVAAAGFYFFRYGLGRPVAATYALFAVVALGGLSRIPGTGRQRAATVARALPVCWLLVIVGTYLSVATWSAVLGMLLVGFALAFSAVGGPRPAGTAPGLQLLYMLPSFPPYDPGSLGDRLIGTTVGLALFVAAEALIFPEPCPPSYRARGADAARTAAHCATLLAAPPYALTGADVSAAGQAGQALRALTVPEADRPAGPGVRERALAHTGLATRTLLTRLALLPAVPGVRPGPEVSAVLGAVARLAEATAACLRGGPSPVTPYENLVAARAHLSALSAGPTATSAADGTAPAAHPAAGTVPAAHRAAEETTPAAHGGAPAAHRSAHGGAPAVHCASDGSAPAACFSPAVLRRHAAVLEIADAALAMGTAADLAARGRHAPMEVAPGRFWYATARAPVLWWHRLRGHAGRRSVFFQNAVRLALALTAARLVAGVDTLPHGFWATLATLTLTRTTMDDTWSTIRRALAGTLAGALLTAGILILAGPHTAVYAAVLPVWMLFAFTVGPVRGVGWAQGLFTVLVALVFAQLAPPTWQLAEVRVLNVLIGSAIGVVFGLLAWPRGAHDELRRTAAELLRRAAEIVVATSASVAGGGAPAAGRADAGGGASAGGRAGAAGRVGAAVWAEVVGRAGPGLSGVAGHRSLQHVVVLAESAYAQFQSEPVPFGGTARGPAPSAVDWQATLITGHHTLWGADRLLTPPQSRLGAAAAESLDALGARVAARMLLISAALDPGDDTPAASLPLIDVSPTEFAAEPPGAPRLYYATMSWLDALLSDLARIARGSPAVQASPEPEGSPEPQRGPGGGG